MKDLRYLYAHLADQISNKLIIRCKNNVKTYLNVFSYVQPTEPPYKDEIVDSKFYEMRILKLTTEETFQ